jgi:hypothetical protein
MVEAIRDQWVIVTAVVIAVALLAWLWRGKRRGT